MSQNYNLLNARVGYQNVPVTGVKAEGTGIPTITVAAADCSNTTLDLAIAATSGITGDKALNYGSVHIAAGTIATGNCTLTLGDGLYVGQVLEIVCDGTMVTSDVVITITSMIGTTNTITMDALGEGLLAVWNGAAWHVLSGSVQS